MQRTESKNQSEEDNDIYQISKNELVENDILNSEEANKLLESKRQNKREATKIGAYSYLTNKFSRLRELFSHRRSYGKIKTVEVNDNIKLNIEYNNHTTSIEISPNSDVIPNILEYYNVDTLQELENKNIYVQYTDFIEYNEIKILLPHNVSLVGLLRYKLYISIFNIVGLLYFDILYTIETLMSTILMIPLIGLFATQSTMLLIFISPIIIMVGYSLINILLLIVSFVLYTDNFKIYRNEYNN